MDLPPLLHHVRTTTKQVDQIRRLHYAKNTHDNHV